MACQTREIGTEAHDGFDNQSFRDHKSISSRYSRRNDSELLNVRQTLKSNEPSDKDIISLQQNKLLDNIVTGVVQSLAHPNMLKLALLTWYFDASFHLPSQGLFEFLKQPREGTDGAWRILHEQYQGHTEEKVSFEVFKKSFDELMSNIPVSHA